MAPGVAIDARDNECALVVGDAKEELAKLALGLIPAHRTVHYIDLGHPEIGFNPLTIDASPGTRASVFLGALIEANPPGAIQARSDDLLRQAVTVVCAVEQRPTVWDVYRMLSPGDSTYREQALTRLDQVPGMDFARYYWRREFPELLRDRSRTLEVLDPPLNKLRRLLSTPQVDVVLRHPYSLDIEGAIATRRGDRRSTAPKRSPAKTTPSCSSSCCCGSCTAPSKPNKPSPNNERRRVSLYVDEAHNVLTPSVATLLAEGRSAGLEACFAWQYSAQVRDELVRSGVRSLLQSISIFRMRELEDARSLAGLAMDVYSDHISIDQAEQERLRFSADDIIHLPVHTAINLWVAQGTPRAAFVARTLPMEELYDPAARATSPRGATRPRRPPPHPPGRPTRTTTRRTVRRPERDPGARARATRPPRAPGDNPRRPRLRTSCCWRTCSDAARQLPRRAPLRRSDHPAPTLRRARTGARCASATSPSCATSGATTSSPPNSSANSGGPAKPPRPHGAGSSSCSAAATSSASGPTARAAPTNGPTTSPPAATACCESSARSTPTRASNHAKCSTTAAPSTTSKSTPGCSPTAACSAPPCSSGKANTSSPHREQPAKPNAALDDDWSIEGLRDPQPRPVVPDAALQIADDGQREPAHLPDRVRPHQPHRQELRQVPPLRQPRRLVVAPHPARGPRRRRPTSCSSARTRHNATTSSRAPTTNSPATAGTPATPPSSTNTSAAGASCSATNATSTTDSSKRDACPRTRPDTPPATAATPRSALSACRDSPSPEQSRSLTAPKRSRVQPRPDDADPRAYDRRPGYAPGRVADGGGSRSTARCAADVGVRAVACWTDSDRQAGALPPLSPGGHRAVASGARGGGPCHHEPLARRRLFSLSASCGRHSPVMLSRRG